jgi:hypothetical protein
MYQPPSTGEICVGMREKRWFLVEGCRDVSCDRVMIHSSLVDAPFASGRRFLWFSWMLFAYLARAHRDHRRERREHDEHRGDRRDARNEMSR